MARKRLLGHRELVLQQQAGRLRVARRRLRHGRALENDVLSLRSLYDNWTRALLAADLRSSNEPYNDILGSNIL